MDSDSADGVRRRRDARVPGGAALLRRIEEAPLAGREPELALLRQAFARAQEGRVQVVVLEGEAGIGKTRLAEAFLSAMRAEGAEVLSGRAHATARGVPYAALVGTLRDRLEQEAAPQELLETVWLAELTRLLPEVRARYPDLPAVTAHPTRGRDRQCEAVARLGSALAARAPLVLFVDDLQWAALATRDMLRQLARRWAAGRVRVVILLAVRAEDVATDVPLARWLDRLAGVAPLTRLAVSALGPEAVRQWVTALSDTGDQDHVHAFGSWLVRQTQGHPFYMVQMVATLLSAGVLSMRRAAHDHWALDVGASPWLERWTGNRPAGVQALIDERLARLDTRAAAVLAAGAVLGGQFTAAGVLRVAAVEKRIGLRALDTLVRACLLQETVDGYAFGHDLVEAAVYQELGAARRQASHRRALAVREDEGAPAAELARQALSAGLRAPSVRYSLAAGDAALDQLAVRDALAHYERARLVAELPAPDPAPDDVVAPEDLTILYLHLGRAYELAQDPAQAEAVYRALRALARQQGLPRAEIAALSHLAMLVARSAVLERAQIHLEEALSIAEASGDRAAWVEVKIHLANIAQSDPAAAWDAQRHGEQALALAQALDDGHLVAASLHTLSYIAGTRGDFEHMAALAAAAAERYAALDTHAPSEILAASRTVTGPTPSARLYNRVMEADCLHQVSCARTLTGEPTQALEAARAALAILQAETAGEHDALALAFGYNDGPYSLGLAYALLELGAYAEALRLTAHEVARLRALDMPFVFLWVLDAHTWVHLALGQGAAARTLGEELLRQAQRLPLPLFLYQANARLCSACLLTGDWAQAHGYAIAATEVRQTLALADLTHADLTVALLRGGSAALADVDLRCFGREVGTNRRMRIPYLRAQAALAQAQGAPAEALTQLEEAEALATALGLPGEQGQVAALLAQMHRELGNMGEATQAQARAVAVRQTLAEGLPDPAVRAAFLAARP